MNTTDISYIKNALPKRSENSNKSTYGRVLLICGSDNMRGAAGLATLGALRCGAGLVTLASTRAVIDALSQSIYEAMYFDVSSGDVIKKAETMNSVGIGCGLGNSPSVYETVRALVESEGAPTVIDADGLNALSGHTEILKKAKRRIILTPHPLEFSRLCGLSVAQIQRDRAETARKFAAEHGVTVLLKGSGTVITDGQTVNINPTGNSALAKGGSGDTLCGMICAFAAQGATPLDSCIIAAYLHGFAAERLSQVYSEYGVLANEVASEAAKILCEWTK